MAHEDHRTRLRGNHSPGDGDIVVERDCRILDDADPVPILLQDVVNALPTRTVHEPTVDEHDGNGRGFRSTHNALLSVPLTASRLRRTIPSRVVCGWSLGDSDGGLFLVDGA